MDGAARVREAFWARHHRAPRVFRAPGRVNLIGEHTDYNDGFVLPLAIEAAAFLAAEAREDGRVGVTALDAGEHHAFALAQAPSPGLAGWRAYVEGMARTLAHRGHRLVGAELVFSGDVPQGAGLSSSAALLVATGLALLELAGEAVDPVELALCAQEAEHAFAGTRCGIMDPYASALSREGHALLIDCRSLEATPVRLELGGHRVLILDSGVKHALAQSAYNDRRGECEEAVAKLKPHLPGIRALRDVTAEDLARYGEALPPTLRARARHVVTENQRTLEAAGALGRGDLAQVGRLFAASHASLRDDYQVSCPELDLLVEQAAVLPGVAGARMTGGGFGGSTVNLVRAEVLEEVVARVSERFEARFGRRPTARVTRAAGGAGEITPLPEWERGRG